MSNERELLKEIMSYFAKGDITIRKFENSSDVAETLHTAQELLAQPEQPEQEPLSEATINYYLERLGSHLKWDDGFIAGVKWAEKAHGITGVDDE